MRVALLGATGRTGQLLLDGALEARHELRVLVRDPAKLRVRSHPDLDVLVGDACVAVDIERTLEGAQVVLMALGHTATSSSDVLARAAGHVIEAARMQGVRRIVALTTGAILHPADAPTRWHRSLVAVAELMLRQRFADARRQAQLIARSGIEHVLVRASRLRDGPSRGVPRAGYLDGPVSATVARADVARFMLAQLDDDAFVGHMPFVSERV